MESKKSIQQYYAHGKLLLTGEYFVLDGAKALAVPTKLGQSLSVGKTFEAPYKIYWKSVDHQGNTWFSAVFEPNDFNLLESPDSETAQRLQQVFKAVRKQNPSFLKDHPSTKIETKLEFPRLWGLGTSSTLIYNLAQWSETNAFRLLDDTFGGSGYDIACAGAKGPIQYQKTSEDQEFTSINFDPPFKSQLYFVYLGKKQNSREGIKHYLEKVKNQPKLIEEVTGLTEAVIKAKDFPSFEKVLKTHENLVSKTLKLPKVQDQYFSDFPGAVKSLGAWGGDFVLAASDWEDTKVKHYFNEKGFNVFLKYEELILIN